MWEAKGKDNFHSRVGVRSTHSRGVGQNMTRRCKQNMERETKGKRTTNQTLEARREQFARQT
jgi:hypothetical protein